MSPGCKIQASGAASYIWAKYSLEDLQNPKDRAEFQEKLAHFLAIAKDEPEHCQIWLWDETGFSLRSRRKSWGQPCRKSVDLRQG